ncbi:Uma2 family endonuclease [Chlorogloeopsis sp. ULAP02]|uniref:Uma2 family endonuclease n=1 Tax=Chlorogloeopsis sp. ULAP02 TaxID=3107926 RepID=UPI0031365E1E
MTVSIPIQAIELAPGSQIAIHNLSWQDFEQILADLGEKRHTRIAYYRGTLEIMSPLALHERPHRIIAYIITTILEIQGRNWEDFGSTTFKQHQLTIYILQASNYVESAFSPTFPNLSLHNKG